MTTVRPTQDILSDLLSKRFTGGTVPVIAGMLVPDSGYVVAHKGYGLILGDLHISPKVKHYAIKSWIDDQKNRAAFSGDFFGVWQDFEDENRPTYFSVVRIFPERAIAEEYGAEQGEIAIWDLGKGEEIRL